MPPLDDTTGAGTDPNIKPPGPSADKTNSLVQALMPKIQPALEAEEKQAKELKGAVEQTSAKIEGIGKQSQEAYDLFKAKLPEAPPPPPTRQPSDPWQAWGSPAMAFAMLASAFTRRPAINAMNAAAGVINAYHANDEQAFKDQYQHWKDQTEYAHQLYEYQRDVYQSSMDKVKTDLKQAEAELTVKAKAFNDEPLSRVIAAIGAAGALDLARQRAVADQEAQARLPGIRADAEKKQQETAARKEALSAYEDLKKDPNNAEAQQRYQRAQETLRIIEGKTTNAAEDRLRDENALYEKLKAQWIQNNQGKEFNATVEADLHHQAHLAFAGTSQTQSASQGREADLRKMVDADVEKFISDKPDASSAEIDRARYQSRLKHEGEMNRAVHAAKSGPAIAIQKYLEEHPEATWQEINEANAEVKRLGALEGAFAGGILGRQVVSLNTVSDHLHLVRQYFNELDNGQIPAANSIANRIAVELGKPQVTTFEAGRDIMADEVVRLLTSTGGTERDREGMQGHLAKWMSPDQGHGVLVAFDQFVGGRFEALEQQYSEGDQRRRDKFQNQLLTAKSRDLWDRVQQAERAERGGATAPAAGGAGAPRAAPTTELEQAKKAVSAKPGARAALRKLYIDRGGNAADFDREIPE